MGPQIGLFTLFFYCDYRHNRMDLSYLTLVFFFFPVVSSFRKGLSERPGAERTAIFFLLSRVRGGRYQDQVDICRKNNQERRNEAPASRTRCIQAPRDAILFPDCLCRTSLFLCLNPPDLKIPPQSFPSDREAK